MKKINFINPVPEKQRRELIWWFLITGSIVSFIIGTIIMYCVLMVPRYYSLYAQRAQLEHQLKEFESLSTTHRDHAQEKERLEKQVDRLKKLAYQPKNPASVIQLIASLKMPDVSITSFSLNKKKLTLHGSCVHTPQVITLLEKLKNAPIIKTAYMSSLQPSADTKHAISFIIQSQLN